MSFYNRLSKAALIVTTSVLVSACDSGDEDAGGGGSPTASDFCSFVAAEAARTYAGTVSDLVSDTSGSTFQYSIVSQPNRGSVTMNESTGDYTYSADTNGAQGYSTSFTYAVLENGMQVDTAEVSLIYGAKRIMPLGDSITYGVTRFSGPTGNQPGAAQAIGYRKALYDQLTNDGYIVDFVGSEEAGADAGLADTATAHQGHPGFRTDELASQINTNLNAATPDLILSHSGTNDLYQSIATATAAANVNNLVANMSSWQTTNSQPLSVLVAKIIPSYHGTSGDSSLALATINTFNSEMESSLNASFDNSLNPDFQVEIVDHYSALDAGSDLTNITIDTVGLHPNTGGYAKMASTWYTALTASGELSKCD